MTKTINVVQYGLGPIGAESARKLLEKSDNGIRLVGAIDIDPAKVGKDLGEILGMKERLGIVVSNDARTVFRSTQTHVAVHTTSSFLEKVFSQLAQCAESNVNVVSSTEELFYPYDRHPRIAMELDAIAKRNGITIVGTGVNPGFVMDTLPLMATGMCTKIRSITVERVVDASRRRLPLQRKIGAGMSVSDFEEKKKSGTFGHIGLRESLLFIAAGLEWNLQRVEESLAPMIATKDIKTPYFEVARGQVSGIHQIINGYNNATHSLSLDLKMYVGADNPHDSIFVDGDPPIDLEIKTGVFGDSATVAALVNIIPLVVASGPGLMTMKELPVLRSLGS